MTTQYYGIPEPPNHSRWDDAKAIGIILIGVLLLSAIIANIFL